ncbi:hypothetical protein [Neobacillus rhizophilus]|uniref:hypothetical protein n=1 Tax=Neobacillus rhizophilus TaxID=2833579 RepID=UPI0027DC3F6E|nr:hypothetical protein [Neobacillus rhizophilus]
MLLASVALEELALAHLLNAEAEKLQFVLGTITPTRTTFSPAVVSLSNLIDLDTSVQRTIRDMIKKEMLLEFKFENILDLIPTICTPTTGATFSNPQPINPIDGVPGTNPYPSNITVSGLQGTISKVTVTITNFVDDGGAPQPPANVANRQHDMFLVVAPDGTAVLIFSHNGDNGPVGPVTLTFDDDSPNPLPVAAGGTLTSGTFRPSNQFDNHTFPAPAPPAPYALALSAFNGLDPNGTWSLYAFDEFGGAHSRIEGGWSLTLSTACPLI